MGLSASKRIKSLLNKSPEFDSACDSAYNDCLTLTEHAFQGVLLYQLPTASDQIHTTISSSPDKHPLSLILKWAPSPPSWTQIDSALLVVSRQQLNTEEERELILGPAQFKEWAAVLYSEAVLGNAGKAILMRVPVGATGIIGIGAVTRSGANVAGAAIGVYALGVATSIYLSLSG